MDAKDTPNGPANQACIRLLLLKRFFILFAKSLGTGSFKPSPPSGPRGRFNAILLVYAVRRNKSSQISRVRYCISERAKIYGFFTSNIDSPGFYAILAK